jgi:hypothetical protein
MIQDLEEQKGDLSHQRSDKYGGADRHTKSKINNFHPFCSVRKNSRCKDKKNHSQ